MRAEKLFPSAALLFFAATVPRLLLHELWRDEAWLWLVVTESHSLGQLITPLQRTGEGYLFPLLCYAASRISTSPRAMQLLHVLLASCGAFVFLRFAPLRRIERVLFIAGYFPFYEYAVISRHYVAGLLLAWCACAAARARRPAVPMAIALALLCQTTVFGFILAIAIGFGWLLTRPQIPVVAWIVVLAGAIAGVVQLKPAPGTTFAPWWRFGWDRAVAGKVLAIPWRGFVPLPLPRLEFWNTNILDNTAGLQTMLGLIVLALAVAMLWRSKVAIATFVVGAIGLLVFAYLKFPGELRHQGHIWILFVAAMWLGGESPQGWRRTVFAVLLIVQIAAAMFASWIDLRHPFSNGPATAALLQAQHLDGYPLVAYREPPASAVALPLGKPLYFASRGVFTTYPDWGPKQRDLTLDELHTAARQLAEREHHDIVIVANRDLPPWSEISLAGSTNGAIVASENYRLYVMHATAVHFAVSGGDHP